MNKKYCILAIVLCLGLNLASRVGGQTSPAAVYSDEYVTPELQKGLDEVLRGDFEKGMAAFRKIAQENPRTTLGAVATCQIAQFTESPSERLAMQQKLANDFVGSCFEIKGKLALLNHQYPDTSEQLANQYLAAVDRLGQQYGGPSIQDIIHKKHGPLAAKIRRLPREMQIGLQHVYESIHKEYSFRSLGRPACFRIAHFQREAFPFLSGTNIVGGEITTDYMLTRFRKIVDRHYPNPLNSPVVRVDLPRSGNKGPRPKIQFVVGVGAWPAAPVDLRTMVCTLDDVDIKSQLSVKSELDELGKGDRPYEILTFSYRSNSKLIRGPHRLKIQVSIAGWTTDDKTAGITSIDVPFNVIKSSDDQEDEDDRDRDDD